eukprot:1613206-Amphidinium_carterae.2
MAWDEYVSWRPLHCQGTAARDDTHDRPALAENVNLPAWSAFKALQLEAQKEKEPAKKFDVSSFGERNAYVCAHEWADIMDFLYERWLFVGQSLEKYKTAANREEHTVSIAMQKTLSSLSGMLTESIECSCAS